MGGGKRTEAVAEVYGGALPPSAPCDARALYAWTPWRRRGKTAGWRMCDEGGWLVGSGMWENGGNVRRECGQSHTSAATRVAAPAEHPTTRGYVGDDSPLTPAGRVACAERRGTVCLAATSLCAHDYRSAIKTDFALRQGFRWVRCA